MTRFAPATLAAFKRMQSLTCACPPDDLYAPLCRACREYWKCHTVLEDEFGVRAFPIVEPLNRVPPYTAAQRRYRMLAEACD